MLFALESDRSHLHLHLVWLNGTRIRVPSWCGLLGQVWMGQSCSGVHQKHTKQACWDLFRDGKTSERFSCGKIWPSLDPTAGRTAHVSRRFNGIVLHVYSGLLKSSLGECVPTHAPPLTCVAAFWFVSPTPLLIQTGALCEKEPKRLKNFKP